MQDAADTRIGASVELLGLGKKYDAVVAVRSVDLSVRPGEFLSLLGASGSGKSTLLRMIAGLEKPTSGRILIDGKDSTHAPPEARDIGMVFQDYALFPHMTVRENIAFPLKLRRIPRKALDERVASVMEMVSIEPFGERKPAQLSGGQQQRVAIARAIVFSPKLLLLDEPLSALDKRLREQTKGEIRRLHRRLGITIVYVTHDQSEALAMSDRVAVMNKGELTGVDTPLDLYRRPGSRFIAEFVGDANLIEVEVVRNEDAGIAVSSPWGEFVVPRNRVRLEKDVPAGHRLSAVLRPEHIAFAADGHAGDAGAVIEATVIDALYNGADSHYAVACPPTGQVLKLKLARPDMALLQEGDVVPIRLRFDYAVLVHTADQATPP